MESDSPDQSHGRQSVSECVTLHILKVHCRENTPGIELCNLVTQKAYAFIRCATLHSESHCNANAIAYTAFVTYTASQTFELFI